MQFLLPLIEVAGVVAPVLAAVVVSLMLLSSLLWRWCSQSVAAIMVVIMVVVVGGCVSVGLVIMFVSLVFTVTVLLPRFDWWPVTVLLPLVAGCSFASRWPCSMCGLSTTVVASERSRAGTIRCSVQTWFHCVTL